MYVPCSRKLQVLLPVNNCKLLPIGVNLLDRSIYMYASVYVNGHFQAFQALKMAVNGPFAKENPQLVLLLSIQKV